MEQLEKLLPLLHHLKDEKIILIYGDKFLSLKDLQIDGEKLIQHESSQAKLFRQASIGNLQAKLEKLENVPICAQRIAKEILLYVQLKLISAATINLLGHKITLNNALVDKLLALLRQRLIIEELISDDLDNNLKQAQTYLQQQAWQPLNNQVTKILKIIESFCVSDLQDIITVSENSVNAIEKDSQLILMLGKTGVGKSTTVHFLAGSTLTKNPGENYIFPSKIKNPALEKIVTNAALGSSKTRFLTAVPIDCKEMDSKYSHKLILCDAPGFGDLAGAEVDVGNSINVHKAINRCQSVKILILLSKKSIGDRGEGLRETVRLISRMFHSAKNHIKSFIYGFTNYDKNEDKEINDFIRKVLDEERAKRYSDQNFIAILEDIVDKTAKEALIIDPIQDHPSKLLDKLVEADGIENPAQLFHLAITQSSLNKVSEQAKVYLQAVMRILERGEVELFTYYLGQLFWLKENLVQENLVSIIEKVLTSLIAYTDELYKRAMQLLEQGLVDTNALEKAEVECLTKLIKEIEQWENLAINYSAIEQINTKSELLQQVIVNKGQALLEFEESVDVSHMAKRLVKIKCLIQNLNLNKTKEVLETAYQTACSKLIIKLQAQLQVFENFSELPDFNNLIAKLDNLSFSFNTLGIHVLSSLDSKIFLNKIEINILSYLEQHKAALQAIFYKGMWDHADLIKIQYILTIAISVKASAKVKEYVRIELLEIICDSIIEIAIDYIKRLCSTLEIQLQTNQPAILRIQSLVEQIIELRNIKVLGIATIHEYYQLTGIFYSYIGNSFQKLSQICESVWNLKTGINWLRLVLNVNYIKKMSWIEKVFPDTYSIELQQFNQVMLCQLDFLAKKFECTSLSNNHLEDLITVQHTLNRLNDMSALDELSESFKIQRKVIIDKIATRIAIAIEQLEISADVLIPLNFQNFSSRLTYLNACLDLIVPADLKNKIESTYKNYLAYAKTYGNNWQTVVENSLAKISQGEAAIEHSLILAKRLREIEYLQQKYLTLYDKFFSEFDLYELWKLRLNELIRALKHEIEYYYDLDDINNLKTKLAILQALSCIQINKSLQELHDRYLKRYKQRINTLYQEIQDCLQRQDFKLASYNINLLQPLNNTLGIYNYQRIKNTILQKLENIEKLLDEWFEYKMEDILHVEVVNNFCSYLSLLYSMEILFTKHIISELTRWNTVVDKIRACIPNLIKSALYSIDISKNNFDFVSLVYKSKNYRKILNILSKYYNKDLQVQAQLNHENLVEKSIQEMIDSYVAMPMTSYLAIAPDQISKQLQNIYVISNKNVAINFKKIFEDKIYQKITAFLAKTNKGKETVLSLQEQLCEIEMIVKKLPPHQMIALDKKLNVARNYLQQKLNHSSSMPSQNTYSFFQNKKHTLYILIIVSLMLAALMNISLTNEDNQFSFSPNSRK